MAGLTQSAGSGICSLPMLALTKASTSGYLATTPDALPGLKVSFPSMIYIIVPSKSGLCGTDSTYYHQ